MDLEQQPRDTLAEQDEPQSARVIMQQLELAEDAMREWNDWCDTIDDRYSLSSHLTDTLGDGYTDQRYDLLWSSMEVIKPAIYTRMPKPVAAPKFSEKTRLLSTASEMVERCIDTSFELGSMHDAMLEVRDDLAMTGRGVLWVRREEEEMRYEHIDRKDFRHEPARKWYDVGWVARRGWMTKTEIKDRFPKLKADHLDSIFVKIRRDDSTRGASDESLVAGVWEVWHKADKKVYWVADGCDEILEKGEPHHKIRGFFPCPRPAYGTLKRRSLVPVPDYFRYAPMLEQINDLTRRIYDLLSWVKLLGLVPGGGDISEALKSAYSERNTDTLLIEIPAAGFTAGKFVEWVPTVELAATITGLLEARGVIIQDFYQLSGISDIMRGATEASETLGAQQLKSQYGSVRVRDKINELQRIAKDTACIGGEIIAEEFSGDRLQEMSMIELPTDAEIKKQIKDAEQGAQKEMRELSDQMEQAAQNPEADPAQLQEQLQAAQAAIADKYGPALQDAESAVTIEAVVKLLRKDKIRVFSIDIATDSTVLTDEITEKQQRNELMGVVSQSMASAAGAAAMGKEALALWGGMFKFTVSAYKAGREIDGLIDDVVDNAEEIAARMSQEQSEQPDDGLAASQMELAKAEMAKVEAQSANYAAQAQLKAQELQLKGQEAQAQFAQQQEEFRLEIEKAREDVEETRARAEKLIAETQEIRARIGVPAAKVQIDAAKAAADAESRRMEQDRAEREGMHNAQMQERQQGHTEATTARQQEFTERNTAEEREFQAQQAATATKGA